MENSEKTATVRGTPFPPGVSGNPNGRPPKGYSITEAFKTMLSSSPETKAEIVEAIRQKALKGDPTAQKLIWNYMDGMPQQDIGLGGLNGEPLTVNIKMV